MFPDVLQSNALSTLCASVKTSVTPKDTQKLLRKMMDLLRSSSELLATDPRLLESIINTLNRLKHPQKAEKLLSKFIQDKINEGDAHFNAEGYTAASKLYSDILEFLSKYNSLENSTLAILISKYRVKLRDRINMANWKEEEKQGKAEVKKELRAGNIQAQQITPTQPNFTPLHKIHRTFEVERLPDLLKEQKETIERSVRLQKS